MKTLQHLSLIGLGTYRRDGCGIIRMGIASAKLEGQA
jgi:hypothetical protein